MKITLTVAEFRHLCGLLYGNEQDGTYSGNRKQYWARHERIVKKFQAAEIGNG